jgi:hypothetical protein
MKTKLLAQMGTASFCAGFATKDTVYSWNSFYYFTYFITFVLAFKSSLTSEINQIPLKHLFFAL